MFSPMETKILKILGKKKVSIKIIAEELFKDEKKPINPGNTVATTISRINKKCIFHKLDWFIDGKGLGRQGRVVWLIKNY